MVADWSNRPRTHLYSYTLSWHRANQSLFFLLKAASLAKKEKIPILYSLVWPVMTFAGICSFSVKVLQLFVVVYVYLLICQFIGMIIDPCYPLTNQYYISVCKFYFVENVGTCLATIFKIKWFLRNILYFLIHRFKNCKFNCLFVVSRI